MPDAQTTKPHFDLKVLRVLKVLKDLKDLRDLRDLKVLKVLKVFAQPRVFRQPTKRASWPF